MRKFTFNCQVNWPLKKSTSHFYPAFLAMKYISEKNFFLNKRVAEIVQEFTILPVGVKISSTGNFQNHKTLTKEKVLHALFKLTTTVYFKRVRPKQALKLFDTLIRPIMKYGCEVWGEPTEKVHLTFLQILTGS